MVTAQNVVADTLLVEIREASNFIDTSEDFDTLLAGTMRMQDAFAKLDTMLRTAVEDGSSALPADWRPRS